ncbi:MAG: hypothetical protein ABI571_04425 [Actinomycetota bacterium]
MLKRLMLCVVAASLAVPALVTTASAAPVQLDVVARDYSYSGIPYRLTPRFYKFNFSNQGQHDHELVLVRKRDGVKRTWQGLLEMDRDEAIKLVTFPGHIEAKPGKDGKAIKTYLRQGSYLAICFIQSSDHAEPHFLKGQMRKFKVEK